ncbi:hypothetical protein BH23GEM6_BH23GEM6_09370 [soil metagenome]
MTLPISVSRSWKIGFAALAFCTSTPISAASQQRPLVLVGAYVESNYSTQPGLQVSYGSPALLRSRPRFSASYSTTRLATTLGSNALVEDRLQAGAAWYFRPDRALTPYTALHVGFTRFDREDDQLFELLENNAPIVSLLAGMEGRLRRTLRASGGVGYSALQSSTVYPFVATLGLHYELNRGQQ